MTEFQLLAILLRAMSLLTYLACENVMTNERHTRRVGVFLPIQATHRRPKLDLETCRGIFLNPIESIRFSSLVGVCSHLHPTPPPLQHHFDGYMYCIDKHFIFLLLF